MLKFNIIRRGPRGTNVSTTNVGILIYQAIFFVLEGGGGGGGGANNCVFCSNQVRTLVAMAT